MRLRGRYRSRSFFVMLGRVGWARPNLKFILTVEGGCPFYSLMSAVSNTLSELNPGQSGRILKFLGGHGMHLRLMEMGLLPGTEVRCVRTAPMGDPLEVEVRGYKLSLRRAEAATIAIETL
jgi:ferrous iron transport protein A